jgi:putative tricarboxylic transport membrane protein
MIDRVFAAAILLLALGYGSIAFTLEAPFQYDPLGPGAWPSILTVVVALCAVGVLLRPDPDPSWGDARTLTRVGAMLVSLVAYAALFEPLGFIISTAVFCAGTALSLKARPLPALLFGLGLGVIGYLVGVELLSLNLPSGPLRF